MSNLTYYDDVIRYAERINNTTTSASPYAIVGTCAQRLADLLRALQNCEDENAKPFVNHILHIYGVDAPEVTVPAFTVEDIHPATDAANLAPAIIEALSTK